MSSFVDLRTFVQVIDTRHRASPTAVMRAFPAPRRDYTVLLQKARAAASREQVLTRVAHEQYHFLQHVWLPYLYVYGAAVWRAYTRQWEQLAAIDTTFDWRAHPLSSNDPWASLSSALRIQDIRSLPEPPRPALAIDEIYTMPDFRTRFDEYLKYQGVHSEWWRYFNQSVQRQPAQPQDPLRTLSPWELMEGAASHFEYRQAAPEFSPAVPEGDAVGFERWSVEVGGYRNVYDLFLEFMDPDLAFKLLPMIITAAFHTTNPVAYVDNFLQTSTVWPHRRFAELPGRAVYSVIMQGLDFERSFRFDEPDWILNSGHERDEPQLIPDDQLDEAPWAHPLLKQFRGRRRKILDTDPGISDFPALPFYRDRLKYLGAFLPPITMYLVDDEPEAGSWALVPVVDQTVVSSDLLQEILVHHAAFDALDELAGRLSSQPHMCPWVNCRFHQTRLCRGNFNTPATARMPELDCWFPDYLAMAHQKMTKPYVLSPHR